MGTRANVPCLGERSRRTASSPEDETATMAVLEKTRERHSGLPKRAEKISTGLPSQEALYSTVCPSGANLAVITLPFRKVSRWNTGAGAFAPAPTRQPAKNDAATRT